MSKGGVWKLGMAVGGLGWTFLGLGLLGIGVGLLVIFAGPSATAANCGSGGSSSSCRDAQGAVAAASPILIVGIIGTVVGAALIAMRSAEKTKVAIHASQVANPPPAAPISITVQAPPVAPSIGASPPTPAGPPPVPAAPAAEEVKAEFVPTMPPTPSSTPGSRPPQRPTAPGKRPPPPARFCSRCGNSLKGPFCQRCGLKNW